MTHQERDTEAQRLMALLSGQGDPVMITEGGTVVAGHNAVPEEEDECECHHCGVFVDHGDGGVSIDGDLYCEACAPIAEKLSRTQCVCYFCEGKYLVYLPMEAGARPTWQTCPACEGKGWTTWLRTECALPGSRWPHVPGEPDA